ncbi:MAG TPA: TlpA disulfide reductase family protein [Solirubrobacterales bacterium]
MGRKLASGLALAMAAALLAIGCGAGGAGDFDGKHPDYATALAGSPPALAALHRQGNELLPGGLDAYAKRIRALRGYPVIANVWASWCGPCRLEFPTFQRLAAAYGKHVAFLGVDSQDSEGHARNFLDEAPVPYPSYSDPDEEIANELGAIGLPATAFYDREGELVYLDLQPYLEVDELKADIERYALGRGGEGG